MDTGTISMVLAGCKPDGSSWTIPGIGSMTLERWLLGGR